MKKNILEKIAILIIFIILFAVIMKTPLIYKYKNSGKLIINEVMASNKLTIKDSNGNYSDYIEIYNGYDKDINLEGYYLSDDNFNLRKWAFPNITIKSNDYLIVYCDGKNTYSDEEAHTNFKLDSKGEVLSLSNSEIKVLSRIYFNNTRLVSNYDWQGGQYNEANSGSTSISYADFTRFTGNFSSSGTRSNDYLTEHRRQATTYTPGTVTLTVTGTIKS